jgi:hypothetical protein
MPRIMAEEINNTAKVENKTISELLREAWREYHSEEIGLKLGGGEMKQLKEWELNHMTI